MQKLLDLLDRVNYNDRVLQPMHVGATAKRRKAYQGPRYRRWLLCAYAFFFAVVAPFICWGSIGDPSHDHAVSHFVFDEEITVAGLHSSESHGHDYCQHDPSLRHNWLAPDRMETDSNPASETRSAPVVTLVSLLVMLFFCIREVRFSVVRQVVYTNFFLPASDAFRLVPTPPPRRLATCLA